MLEYYNSENVLRRKQSMSNRLPEFDIIRVIAAFSVIAIHVTAGYAHVLTLGYYVNHLVRYAVPMFIILSGFLLYFTDTLKPPLPVAAFYRKRGKRVLYPYILWSLLYSSYNQLCGGSYPSLSQFSAALGHDLLWGTANFHLYFLIIIIQLYLLYPWLRKWLETDASSLLLTALGITLIAQTVYYLCMMQNIILPVPLNLIWVRFFPVWIFYFVLGMMVARSKTYWQHHLPKQVLVPGLTWLAALSLVILDSKLTNIVGSILRPSIILYTVVSFFFMYSLALKIKPIEKPWLSWLSQQSFLIYLLHPLILSLLMRIASSLGHPELWTGIPGMVALYISVAIITIFFTYLAGFNSLTQWIGGVKN